MFYCDPCRIKNKWPEMAAFLLMASRGKCEVCGEHATCHDVPSSALPDPVKEPERWGLSMHNDLSYRLVDGAPDNWIGAISGSESGDEVIDLTPHAGSSLKGWIDSRLFAERAVRDHNENLEPKKEEEHAHPE